MTTLAASRKMGGNLRVRKYAASSEGSRRKLQVSGVMRVLPCVEEKAFQPFGHDLQGVGAGMFPKEPLARQKFSLVEAGHVFQGEGDIRSASVQG